MRDQMNRNPMSIVGVPTLVEGALTVDPDEALAFGGGGGGTSEYGDADYGDDPYGGTSLPGGASYGVCSDSVSLSITGSLSLECFVKLAAYPSTTQAFCGKPYSYNGWITSTGHVMFDVENPTPVSVTSSDALALDTWHHIVCVYNGEYSGASIFGKTSLGSGSAQVDDDNGNNKAASRFTLPETALLESVSISLQYVDEIWPVDMCAVVYADSAGVPGALVTKSAVQTLNPPTPAWRSWTWVNFPLTPAVVPAGNYHIGYVSDTVAGISKAPLIVGRDSSGGLTSRRPDSVSGPSDPFLPAITSNADRLAVYCDYTPVSRTGHEGKILIYINGALNASAAYSGGVLDTAYGFYACPELVAELDELSVWNRPLTDVQIATHYTAH